MQFHEVANILPLMNAEEFTALVADVKVHGLREPIWIYKGKIIDGRNRYQACEQSGIEPQYREYTGDEAGLLSFVLSLNLQRRHLTSSQRAALGVDVEKYLAVEAEKRMLAGKRVNPREIFPQGTGKASDQAAAIVGTNGHYVRDAKKIVETAPEVGEAVRRGILSLPDATVVARLPAEQRQAVLEKVGSIDADIYPNKAKQAIKLVQQEAEEEAWRRQRAEDEARWQAKIATPEYQRREEELHKQAERQKQEEEAQQKARAEQDAARSAEIRTRLNDPAQEQVRASLYEAARQTNLHMEQAAVAYMRFLARFQELTGWVDRDRTQRPSAWDYQFSRYNMEQNVGAGLETENLIHPRLDFQIRGQYGRYIQDRIDLEALQRWIDDPATES